MAELQRKREKKAAQRRVVTAKRKWFLQNFGSFVGERMYQEWRGRKTDVKKEKPVVEKPQPQQPAAIPAAKSKHGIMRRLFGRKTG